MSMQETMFVRQQKPNHGGKYIALCHECGSAWKGQPRDTAAEAESDGATHFHNEHEENNDG